MPGNLFADPDVLGRLSRPVRLKHLGSQRVDEDLAVGGAVERNLADQPFEQRLDLFDVGIAVVSGEIEDRQVPAADHLAEDRLAAAAAEHAEPASARLHVPRFNDRRLGEVFFEALDHLGGVAQVRVFQAGAGQHGVADEEQVLVPDAVGLEVVLAVGNAAANLVEFGRLGH